MLTALNEWMRHARRALGKQEQPPESPAPPEIDEKQLVADHWGETRTVASDWWQSIPAIERRTVRLVGGDEWREASSYFSVLDRYCDPAKKLGRGLTLCCGHGAHSVAIAHRYPMDSLLGLDLAP